MKFKVLTAYSPEEVKEEIERFKLFCAPGRIKDINVVGGQYGWVITISYT